MVVSIISSIADGKKSLSDELVTRLSNMLVAM